MSINASSDPAVGNMGTEIEQSEDLLDPEAPAKAEAFKLRVRNIASALSPYLATLEENPDDLDARNQLARTYYGTLGLSAAFMRTIGVLSIIPVSRKSVEKRTSSIDGRGKSDGISSVNSLVLAAYVIEEAGEGGSFLRLREVTPGMVKAMLGWEVQKSQTKHHDKNIGLHLDEMQILAAKSEDPEGLAQETGLTLAQLEMYLRSLRARFDIYQLPATSLAQMRELVFGGADRLADSTDQSEG